MPTTPDQPRKSGAHHAPPIDTDVSPQKLDPEVRRELRTLPRELADLVSGHLVMAGRLVVDDPVTALAHAREARRRAARLAVVREACGLAAYANEQWAEAIAELRAARRMSGSDVYLPVLADCERGQGRPQRALEAARSAEARRLTGAAAVEMRIVESGARRDLGQYEAALLVLRGCTPDAGTPREYTVRLWYAYADALRDAGRPEEADEWFARAAAAEGGAAGDGADGAFDEGLAVIDVAEED